MIKLLWKQWKCFHFQILPQFDCKNSKILTPIYIKGSISSQYI